MSRGVAALAAAGLTVLASGCNDARTPASTSAAPATSASDSNERTLTHAQSVRLVRWATTFRSCMVSRGWGVGALQTAPTRLSMVVPKSIEVPRMLPSIVTCGDAQGGPPAKSSLQYRARKILLYLPKQCLLDPKVVSS